MKARAVAYATQGLIKYHGKKRDGSPFHDSISVAHTALRTETEAQISPMRKKDEFYVFDAEVGDFVPVLGGVRERLERMVNELRNIAKSDERIITYSTNFIGDEIFSYEIGKGLGFSASAGASHALAIAEVLGLEELIEDPVRMSKICSIFAGSASRSFTGGFSILHARGNYSERLDSGDIELSTLIVPIPSREKVREGNELKRLTTAHIHSEALTSPYFSSRIRYVTNHLIPSMIEAIRGKNVEQICAFAEEDTLLLHGSSWTGKGKIVLWEPETLDIVKKVTKLRREKGIPVYYSIDTGPSVFINTFPQFTNEVYREVIENCSSKLVAHPVLAQVAGGAKLL